MKKLILVASAVSLSFSSFSQIQMDANGRVGIGGIAPSTRLHLRDNVNSIIRLQNGNNYSWNLGSYTTDTWGHQNSLTISDNTGYPFIIFNGTSNEIYCNRNFLVNSWGAIHRNYKGWGGHSEAGGYDFNPHRENTDIGFIFENNYGEGSGFYGDQDYAVIWSPGDFGYLLKLIDEDGMQLKWYVNGSGTAYTNSDKNRKEKIEKINGSLNKIKNISGVTYNFLKTDEEKLKEDSLVNGLIAFKGDIEEYKKKIAKKDFGFIAQELEKIIPEVVETDEKGNKFVNYDGIIPLLVEGMKDQQLIIESMQSEIQALKSGLSKVKSTSNNDVTNSETQTLRSALYQNSPNPFSQSTVIEYYLSENSQNAMICIYDMNGTQLKCIPLHLTEYGSITINGNEFKAGMYIYSLIADGQLIDTKRMVLTD